MEIYDNDNPKVDSQMNIWFAGSKREKVDSMMGAKDIIQVTKSWIFMEGGSIEVNGKAL